MHRQASEPQQEQASPLMEYSTVDGNPTRRGRSSRPRGSGSSVAPVGRHTTRATSMRCAAIGSMRGCLLTLHEPYKMEACPICSGHTTRHDREGWFLCILFVSFEKCWSRFGLSLHKKDQCSVPLGCQTRVFVCIRASQSPLV